MFFISHVSNVILRHQEVGIFLSGYQYVANAGCRTVAMAILVTAVWTTCPICWEVCDDPCVHLFYLRCLKRHFSWATFV